MTDRIRVEGCTYWTGPGTLTCDQATIQQPGTVTPFPARKKAPCLTIYHISCTIYTIHYAPPYTISYSEYIIHTIYHIVYHTRYTHTLCHVKCTLFTKPYSLYAVPYTTHPAWCAAKTCGSAGKGFRGTSLIRNRPPPYDSHRSSDIGLP